VPSAFHVEQLITNATTKTRRARRRTKKTTHHETHEMNKAHETHEKRSTQRSEETEDERKAQTARFGGRREAAAQAMATGIASGRHGRSRLRSRSTSPVLVGLRCRPTRRTWRPLTLAQSV
jgi:hypothetical protein